MDETKGVVITATELKKNLGKYLDMVENQNDVVITKNNRKIARFTPYVTDIEQYFAVRENARDYVYGNKKVSYEEFMTINEKSTLRMELINGEIFLMSSPNLFHQNILGNLHLIFNDYFKGKKCKVIFAPFDVHFFKKGIKDPDIMQPDLLVACDLEGNVNEKGKYMGTPSLVIEILSPSTRSKDMVDKLNTYMLSGVHEYWVIDPDKKQILIYTFKEREIDSYNIYTEKDTVESCYFEGLKARIVEVFEEI